MQTSLAHSTLAFSTLGFDSNSSAGKGIPAILLDADSYGLLDADGYLLTVKR